MYRKIEDFLSDWKWESEATAKVLGALTDDKLNQTGYDGGRSLGFLAWHSIQSIGEMLGRTGLKVDAPDEKAPMPSSAAEIKSAYEKAAASAAEQVKKNWKDDVLETTDDMYGMQWKKGSTLDIMIKHEIHHRAQMTVLMRQAGLRVPGIYGPAKEEWAEMGMEPQA